MESLIETTLIEIIESDLVSNYTDNWPAHVDRYVDDYDLVEDYPVIAIHVEGEALETEEIQAYTKKYKLYIYIVCVDENYVELVEQRRIIKDRIISYMRSNRHLAHLTEPTTNERVQFTRYIGTEYSVGGFAQDWQTIARMEYAIITESIGPF